MNTSLLLYLITSWSQPLWSGQRLAFWCSRSAGVVRGQSTSDKYFLAGLCVVRLRTRDAAGRPPDACHRVFLPRRSACVRGCRVRLRRSRRDVSHLITGTLPTAHRTPPSSRQPEGFSRRRRPLTPPSILSARQITPLRPNPPRAIFLLCMLMNQGGE